MAAVQPSRLTSSVLTRRRLLQLTGGVAAGAMLSSCSDEGNRVASETVQLKLWTQFAADQGSTQALDKMVEKFNREHPSIRVEHQAYDFDSFRFNVLPTAFASGNPPELFSTPGYQWLGEYQQTGQVLDVSSIYAAGGLQYSSDIEGSFTFKGKQYAVPWFIGATVFIYYNKDMFAKHGLSAEDIKTYSGWLSTCQKFKDAGVLPIAFGNKVPFLGLHYVSAFAKTNLGPDLAQRLFLGEANLWTHPGAIESLVQLKELGDREYLPADAVSGDFGLASESFAAGRAAMIGATSGHAGGFESTDFPVAVALWPEIPGKPGKQDDWVFWVNSFSAVKTTPEKDKAAKQVLEAFGSVEYQRVSAEVKPNLQAAREAMPDEVADAPVFTQVANHYKAASRFLPVPDITVPIAVGKTLQEEISAVLGGQVSPERAAENMAAAVRSGLR